MRSRFISGDGCFRNQCKDWLQVCTENHENYENENENDLIPCLASPPPGCSHSKCVVTC